MNKRLKAILNLKCPKCLEGNLFLSSNPYDLGMLGKMPEKCKKCGQDYQIEPGFYFGAAYLSYILNVGILAIIALIVWISGGSTIMEFTIAMILGDLVLVPFTFVLSRSLWIHLGVDRVNKGQKSIQKEKKTNNDELARYKIDVSHLSAESIDLFMQQIEATTYCVLCSSDRLQFSPSGSCYCPNCSKEYAKKKYLIARLEAFGSAH